MQERSSIEPAACWVRVGEPCRLCMPGATGPADCGLAYLVMTDPELCAELARIRAEMYGNRPDSCLFAESEGAVSPEHVGWTHG